MTAFTLLVLLSIHFVADFILQSDWMAVNKSKNTLALLGHTTIYAACFLFYGWKFALVTWVLHTVVDANTSRITTYLWQRQQRHWFFVAIGFDQLLHAWCLALTYFYVFVIS